MTRKGRERVTFQEIGDFTVWKHLNFKICVPPLGAHSAPYTPAGFVLCPPGHLNPGSATGIPCGLSTPTPAPLRRTNNDEDDDAQRILAEYTYTMTSTPFLEIFTSVLRLDVRFVVLAVDRSVVFRWKTVETVTSWHL